MGIKRLPAHIQALVDGQEAPRPTRSRKPAVPVQPEADFMQTVIDYATLRGWHHWHDSATNAPRRCWHCGRGTRIQRNAPGFPDLLLVRRPRVIWVELKREGEEPAPEQVGWLEELKACGQQVYVWRPSDWPEIERVLR